jgi:hypothetical protein
MTQSCTGRGCAAGVGASSAGAGSQTGGLQHFRIVLDVLPIVKPVDKHAFIDLAVHHDLGALFQPRNLRRTRAAVVMLCARARTPLGSVPGCCRVAEHANRVLHLPEQATNFCRAAPIRGCRAVAPAAPGPRRPLRAPRGFPSRKNNTWARLTEFCRKWLDSMLYMPVSGKVRRARSAAAGMQSGAGRSEGSDPCESPVDQEPDDTEDDLLNAFTLLFPGDEPPEGRGQEVEPSRSASGLTMQDEIIETGNTFHDVLSLVSPSMRDRIAPALASFAQERKSSVLLHARFSGGRSVSLLLSNCTIVTITLDADGISVIDCRICKGLAAAVEAECGAGEALCCAGFLASGFCVLCSRSAKMMLIKPRNPAENLNEWRPSALRAAVAPLQQPAMQITVNADQADPPPPPPLPPPPPQTKRAAAPNHHQPR